MAPKTIGSAISDIIAPGGQERAAEDRAALGGERHPAEEAVLEERQAEDREHDVGRAGDDLDAGLDHPRQPLGRPYSTIQTAAATAIGVAITMPMIVIRIVPRIGSRNPPEADWSTSPLGADQSRLGLRYWMPRTAM